jgi:mannose-1-phosphate guanylyltransferase
MGVHDLVIIDTDDAVMVCSREREQDVKKFVEQLITLCLHFNSRII